MRSWLHFPLPESPRFFLGLTYLACAVPTAFADTCSQALQRAAEYRPNWILVLGSGHATAPSGHGSATGSHSLQRALMAHQITLELAAARAPLQGVVFSGGNGHRRRGRSVGAAGAQVPIAPCAAGWLPNNPDFATESYDLCSAFHLSWHAHQVWGTEIVGNLQETHAPFGRWRERLAQAFYFGDGRDSTLVQETPEYLAHWLEGWDYLTSRSAPRIPPFPYVLESTSTSTEENISNSLPLLSTRSLTQTTLDRLLVVSTHDLSETLRSDPSSQIHHAVALARRWMTQNRGTAVVAGVSCVLRDLTQTAFFLAPTPRTAGLRERLAP